MNPPRIATKDAAKAALDALDRLLGSGTPGGQDKIAGLREIEATAKRMADNVERWSRCPTYQENA